MDAETSKRVEMVINKTTTPESEPELQAPLAKSLASLKEQLSANHPLAGDDRQLTRFLIARKLKLPDVLLMIEQHMEWRASTLPIHVTDALVAELKKGKVEMVGKDRSGRPMVIVRSGKFDPAERDLNVAVAAVTWHIEKAIASGADRFTVFYDRADFSLRKNWDKAFIKAIAQLFADNYPERLGAAYIYPAGALLTMLWGLVKNFFDPRTREKVKMVSSTSQLLNLVPAEWVPVESGGTSTHAFDPSQYDSLLSTSEKEPVAVS